MDIVALIGRLAFVLMFLNSGLKHFRSRESMVAHARSTGAPLPEVAVPLSGVMLLAGGLLLAIGAWPDLGALILAAFLFPVAYYMHGFWRIGDAQARAAQETHFWKNVSLGGASLLIFALFAQCGSDIGLTLTGPLF